MNRALALKLTCNKLVELIRADTDLVQKVIAACQQHAANLQRPDPTRLTELKKRKAQLDQEIRFILAHPGNTEEDRQESADQLRKLRHDRTQVGAEMALLESAQQRQVKVPSEQEVLDLINEPINVLTKAALGDSTDEVLKVRNILKSLTGERIELFQQGERLPQKGWLQGRFRVRLLAYLLEKLNGDAGAVEDEGIEVIIDYREPALVDQLADRARDLYKAGLPRKEIARQLGVNPNLAHEAVARGYERQGEHLPDGRTQRSRLDPKHRKPFKYEELTEPVMRFFFEEVLLQDIADRLEVDRNTVTKIIASWHISRGLAVPDGRTRRKGLDQKCSQAKPGLRSEQKADDNGP